MYFPEILIPIIIFFGLTVWLASVISGEAVKNVEKKARERQ